MTECRICKKHFRGRPDFGICDKCRKEGRTEAKKGDMEDYKVKEHTRSGRRVRAHERGGISPIGKYGTPSVSKKMELYKHIEAQEARKAGKIDGQPVRRVYRSGQVMYIELANGAKIQFQKYGGKYHAIPAKGTGPMEVIEGARSLPDAVKKYGEKHNLTQRADMVKKYAARHEDMNEQIAEIALEYAIARKVEDMKYGEDSSVYYGRVTRAGPFLYPDGWKHKDYNNLKEQFQKHDHLPMFGSRTYGSHKEESPETHLVGFATNWEYDDLNKDIYGYQYFFDDIKTLSNLKNPIELPVSIKFDDVGQGNQQLITGLHHLAVSLNKLEDDRCGLEGGKACTISPVGLSNKTDQGSDSNDLDTAVENITTNTDIAISDSSINNEYEVTISDGSGVWFTDYQKLNNSEISEAIDMVKKETSPGAGKPTPNQNEIGSEIEKCAAGDLTEEECKMKQKREERTGKWDGEVSGKMSKDLSDLEITLEDLTALIEENDQLRDELEVYKQESTDLEDKVNKLIKWQEKALKEEEDRQNGELEVIKKDLVDNHSICEKFIENHDTYDFLSEFHKGLPHDAEDIAEEEDENIPTSLADLGEKLDDVKQRFDYMKMD